MSFIDSYKRLDNLCKTFSDYPKGVSSYIEVMEQSYQIRYQCTGWSSDYAQLKKYRHIRNQIAHDNDVYEEDVCTPKDEQWIQNFHARIIDQTDPLGHYYKSQCAAISKPRTVTQPTNIPEKQSSNNGSQTSVSCATCITIISIVAIFVAWFIFIM